MYPIKYMQAFLATCVGSVLYLTNFVGQSRSDAIELTTTLAISWLIGVFSSLTTYRLFFHPLRNFPGPWQARISDLWWSSKLAGFDGYYQIEKFHKKCGKYVRVGSNALSVTDPRIMQAAYGPTSKVVKGDWYDGCEQCHSRSGAIEINLLKFLISISASQYAHHPR